MPPEFFNREFIESSSIFMIVCFLKLCKYKAKANHVSLCLFCGNNLSRKKRVLRLNLEQKVKNIYSEMVQWRRHLHQYPELSFQEKETSAYISHILESMGLEVLKVGIGYGLTVLIQGGNPGPTVALRADIDALPIQDGKSSEFASKVAGIMHACGHDAHTATLLGIAKILSSMREHLHGNIKLIFQPAEEMSPGGALPMIADGVLDGVDVIYGVHLWSPFPLGTMYCKSGPIMAAADEFTIEIRGKGGHGGLPHETVDSVVIGSQLVINLQTIVSRNLNPTEPAVVSVGSIHAGSNFNVIAERCILNGTVRTFNMVTRDYIIERIEEIAAHTCAMYGADYKVEYKKGYPTVVNDKVEAERFFRVAQATIGAENTKECSLIMAGEDFSYYLQKVPGCYIFVGAGNPSKGIVAPHHHPRFTVDEEAMQNSAIMLMSLALDYLEESTG